MKVIFSCAGTGGHIYPAISIADKIRRMEPDSELLFIGTKTGMENSLVPAAGYELRSIDASGFDRRNPLKNFKTLTDMLRGSFEARRIIEDFRPDAVIGTGGYISGIVIRKAAKMGVPCYIHEQNVVPGLANRMLERYVRKVFVSFPESEEKFSEKAKTVFSGNPIRKEFLVEDAESSRKALGLSGGDLMILVTGGSLGAQVLCEAAIELIKVLAQDRRGARVFFVTGRRYYEEMKAKTEDVKGAEEFVKVIPYADDMPMLMSAADLVVSRAGAVAVSEISACGKPSVLIPSPNVTHNHQYFNAKAAADAGAAVLIEEKELAGGYSAFTSAVMKLICLRERLNVMAGNAASVGRADAVDIIYENIKM